MEETGGVVRLSSQTGWCSRSLTVGRGVWADRIAPTHTPIKSIRIVRDGKKTGNHCKKWSFFYQLLNTECTPRSSLSSVAPVPCLSNPFSPFLLLFFLSSHLFLSLSPSFSLSLSPSPSSSLPYSLWVRCISTQGPEKRQHFQSPVGLTSSLSLWLLFRLLFTDSRGRSERDALNLSTQTFISLFFPCYSRDD